MTTQVVHRSTGRDAATGLVSLLALLALVVAIPVLLISFIGWPLPREVPAWDEITAALGDRYVPDRFVVGALACVCWLIWVELVASVVVETVAYVRGEKASDVPLAGGMQKFVGRLIGGAALLVAAFVARGETPDAIKPLVPAQPAPIAELASADVGGAVDEAGEAAADSVQTLPTYTVEPRDTLWAIAEGLLGDPFRWNEIWDLNANKDMGGGRTFRDPDLILPGWQLQLPADALVPGVEATPLDAPADPAPDTAPESDDGGSTSEMSDDERGPMVGGSFGGSGGSGDSEPQVGDGYLSSDDGATTRVEVLQPLDEVVPDGPNGGVIAGPRVETLDPLTDTAELAEDDGVDETAGAETDD